MKNILATLSVLLDICSTNLIDWQFTSVLFLSVYFTKLIDRIECTKFIAG